MKTFALVTALFLPLLASARTPLRGLPQYFVDYNCRGGGSWEAPLEVKVVSTGKTEPQSRFVYTVLRGGGVNFIYVKKVSYKNGITRFSDGAFPRVVLSLYDRGGAYVEFYDQSSIPTDSYGCSKDRG